MTEESELMAKLGIAGKDPANRIAEKKATLDFNKHLPFANDVDSEGNVIQTEPSPGQTPTAFERQEDKINAINEGEWRSDGASHGHEESDQAA